MNNYKISIPEPCNENWGEMTPNDTGRFCQQCTKNVVDFSNMTDEEISLYLMQHKEERVCGRFKQQQLSSITIQIPQKVLFSQTQFRKIFLLALLFSMGTTLLSCSDKSGNKQKIENVIIEENNINIDDSIPPLPPEESFLPPTKRVVKKGELISGMVIYESDSIPDIEIEEKAILQPPLPHLNGAVAIEPLEKLSPLQTTGEVVFEPDSTAKCETIKQRPLHTIGKVALDFEPKKEENNHIQSDTIITPPQ